MLKKIFNLEQEELHKKSKKLKMNVTQSWSNILKLLSVKVRIWSRINTWEKDVYSRDSLMLKKKRWNNIHKIQLHGINWTLKLNKWDLIKTKPISFIIKSQETLSLTSLNNLWLFSNPLLMISENTMENIMDKMSQRLISL